MFRRTKTSNARSSHNMSKRSQTGRLYCGYVKWVSRAKIDCFYRTTGHCNRHNSSPHMSSISAKDVDFSSKTAHVRSQILQLILSVKDTTLGREKLLWAPPKRGPFRATDWKIVPYIGSAAFYQILSRKSIVLRPIIPYLKLSFRTVSNLRYQSGGHYAFAQNTQVVSGTGSSVPQRTHVHNASHFTSRLPSPNRLAHLLPSQKVFMLHHIIPSKPSS